MMDPAAYLEMAETESKHWWFVARRCILSSIINQLGLPSNSKILEVGCGTGGNLDMLARYGEVSALEMDSNARSIALKKTNNIYDIRAGVCPDEIGFHEQSFDLICMFDVLEHIERDIETLVAMKKLLKKNGYIILTVPAYQWLYGVHDVFLHHIRRYSAIQLREKIVNAGINPLKISYFNTFLFPIAVIVRIKDRLLGNVSVSGTNVPPLFINTILVTIFSIERFILKRFNLPFGISLLCIVNDSDNG
jgi:SAM-dependent methyltransferase